MAHCANNNFSFLETVYDFKNKKLDKNKINYVITHGSCPDGFMSATIIKMWLISQKIDKISSERNLFYSRNQEKRLKK